MSNFALFYSYIIRYLWKLAETCIQL